MGTLSHRSREVKAFLDERGLPTEHCMMSTLLVQGEYVGWCRVTGREPMAPSDVIMGLREQNFRMVQIEGVWFWEGLYLAISASGAIGLLEIKDF